MATIIVFESGHTDTQEAGWPGFYFGWEETVWSEPANSAYLESWNHIAMTKNTVVGTQKIYHNGVLVADNVAQNTSGGSGGGDPLVAATRSMAGIGNFYIGCFAPTRGDLWYTGSMDEFMVYDRALSHAEIVFLAKGAGTATLPVDSDANVDNSNEVIDMDDLVGLTVDWLTELNLQ